MGGPAQAADLRVVAQHFVQLVAAAGGQVLGVVDFGDMAGDIGQVEVALAALGFLVALHQRTVQGDGGSVLGAQCKTGNWAHTAGEQRLIHFAQRQICGEGGRAVAAGLFWFWLGRRLYGLRYVVRLRLWFRCWGNKLRGRCERSIGGLLTFQRFAVGGQQVGQQRFIGRSAGRGQQLGEQRADRALCANAHAAHLHKGQLLAVDHPHKARRAAEQHTEAIKRVGCHDSQQGFLLGAQRVRRAQGGQLQIAHKEVCAVGAAQFLAALPQFQALGLPLGCPECAAVLLGQLGILLPLAEEVIQRGAVHDQGFLRVAPGQL